jgi:hypothetical protein
MSAYSSFFMAPSGRFVSMRGYQEGTEVEGYYAQIYNPAIFESYRGQYEITKAIAFQGDEWFASFRSFACRVSDADFDVYGDRLISLTHHILESEPHCSLGPVRGGAKPCALVEVMSRGACEYDYFNYQCGSHAANRQRVLGDLKPILLARNPEEEVYRINVTDTAGGGHGINALVSILKEIKEGTADFRNQKWQLGVRLLHTAEADIEHIEGIKKAQVSGDFLIDLQRFDVPNLIFEDYDPALAFQVETQDGRYEFKPCAKPGRMLCRFGNEAYVVETDNTNLMLNEFVSSRITENLVTSPDHVQIGDVWSDYQSKA